MSKEDIALGMVALKHAMDRIAPAQKELRAKAQELLRQKERVSVELDGELVGTITKSSPKKVAQVSSEPEFLYWMANHYPEHVEEIAYVEDMPKVIEVLQKHAPELVFQRHQVAQSATDVVLANSTAAGVPVGPGGEANVPGISVYQPEGTVSVRPERGQGWLIERMLTSGQVSLDGTVRREIEA